MPTITITWQGSPERRNVDATIAEKVSTAAQAVLARADAAARVVVDMEGPQPS
jgi:phenylpyruvate tautomerase PptA (4-oxalocrotonate tautomerase family)